VIYLIYVIFCCACHPALDAVSPEIVLLFAEGDAVSRTARQIILISVIIKTTIQQKKQNPKVLPFLQQQGLISLLF